MDDLFFSLIATSQGNRPSDLERLLKSLTNQSFSNFELILVDQSEGDNIEKLVAQFDGKVGHQIVRINSRKVSLSKARNIGLQYAEGNVIAFPDDDCWYDKDTLLRVVDAFRETNADGICCGAYDPEKGRYLTARVPKENRKHITVINSLSLPISIGIFVKKSETVKFDEELGVGAKWGGGEESDLILRILHEGCQIEYFRDINVYHPYHNEANSGAYEKNYSYGLGYGALIKKTIKRGQYAIIVDLIITLMRSTGGVIIYSIKKSEKRKIYSSRIKGILGGLKDA